MTGAAGSQAGGLDCPLTESLTHVPPSAVQKPLRASCLERPHSGRRLMTGHWGLCFPKGVTELPPQGPQPCWRLAGALNPLGFPGPCRGSRWTGKGEGHRALRHSSCHHSRALCGKRGARAPGPQVCTVFHGSSVSLLWGPQPQEC